MALRHAAGALPRWRPTAGVYQLRMERRSVETTKSPSLLTRMFRTWMIISATSFGTSESKAITSVWGFTAVTCCSFAVRPSVRPCVCLSRARQRCISGYTVTVRTLIRSPVHAGSRTHSSAPLYGHRKWRKRQRRRRRRRFGSIRQMAAPSISVRRRRGHIVSPRDSLLDERSGSWTDRLLDWPSIGQLPGRS